MSEAIKSADDLKCFEGWGKKQGHNYKGWKQRYFVLDDYTLRYYTDYNETADEPKNQKGELFIGGYRFGDVSDSTPVKADKSPSPGSRLFLIPPKNSTAKDLLMEFSTPELCGLWKDAINSHFKHFSSQRRLTQAPDEKINFDVASGGEKRRRSVRIK
jgi:hypothetical protein